MDGTHTNSIEGFWGNARSKFKATHGVNKAQLDGHLDELMYCYNHLKQIDGIQLKLDTFIHHISQIYVSVNVNPVHANLLNIPDNIFRN